MVNNQYNPIRSVDGAEIISPSGFKWQEEDVSKSDAGRTEDGLMHKNRLRQVVAIDLQWNNITTAEASGVLTAFSPEYINVTYLDPKAGTYISKKFYVGNRSAPLYNAASGRWSNVAFRIIER